MDFGDGIKLGIQFIKSDKLDDLFALIDNMKINTQSPEEKVKSVIPWVNFCVGEDKDHTLLCLVDSLKIIWFLFTSDQVSVSVLRKVVSLLKLTPQEVISKVPSDKPSVYAKIEFTFYHCPLLFGKLEPMTFEVMQKWEQSFDSSRPGLNTYLITRLDELKEYAPVPNYIIPHQNPFISEEELMVTDHQERDFTFPSGMEDQVDFIINKLVYQKKKDKKVARAKILNDWKNSDHPEEQEILVNDVYKSSFSPRTKEEIEVCRIWGPINPIPDEEDDPESCYMLGHYDSWFTGVCETCDMGIQEYYFAVRVPVSEGGWAGCYCSLKCASSDDITFYPSDLKRIADELNDHGIYYRGGQP
jgi:hypothetical protein